MVEPILERGGTFHGIDISEAMLREARTRFAGRSGVSFSQGDVESLPVADGACDQVIAMGILEYLKEPRRMFAETARVLRPGGIAIVTVPRRWHIDRIMLALTAPLRAVARGLGASASDRLPRLCLQPRELDAAAAAVGLAPEGGAHYYFTVLPYPLTRFAPTLAMNVNRRFERWHSTRRVIPRFFAHGYIGRYRKPSGSNRS
jgi:SAM-dependent methyltransferase